MFVTTCTRDYLVGLEVLLQSLVDHNAWLEPATHPFVVLSNDLTTADLAVAQKIYPNVKVRGYDAQKYAPLDELRRQAQAFGDYSKYEVFSIPDAERVIFLDVDALIMGDISALVKCVQDFAAVRELYIDQFNTGVMVIGKKYLSPRVTADLIRLTQVYGVTEHLDQDIINYYFDGEIYELPLAYNFLKIYHKPIFRRDGLAKYVKILHYVVKKPWQQAQPVALEEGTLWLERYWYSVYAKTLRLRHDAPVPTPAPVTVPPRSTTLPPLRTRDELGQWMTQMGYTLAVEVGVQRGDFSRQLLSTWQGQLVMIDAWERLPNYQDVSNVYNEEHLQCMAAAQQVAQEFAPRGLIVKAKSPECAGHYADGTLDLVYLDADHSYEAVLADIQVWLPKIRPGGAIAGHDYLDGDLPQGKFGVKRAVNEFFGRPPDLVTQESWATWLYLVPGRSSA